ncbi:hypothetical protein CsSME_00001757 [Camellia sinensis var. sinensis]
MTEVFRPHLRRFILVFFDYILVYSSSWTEHLQHLQVTLQLVRAHQLFAKRFKCVFGKQEVKYLGHLVTDTGVSAESTKISAMTNWPVPKTIKEFRGFLGLIGYHRRFVQDYGKMAAPLNQLLRKDSFQWTEETSSAFSQLKTTMTTIPVVALSNYTCQTIPKNLWLKQMHLERDWEQCSCKRDTLFLFGVKAYLKEIKHYLHLRMRKLMAVVLAVLKWRPYL